MHVAIQVSATLAHGDDVANLWGVVVIATPLGYWRSDTASLTMPASSAHHGAYLYRFIGNTIEAGASNVVAPGVTLGFAHGGLRTGIRTERSFAGAISRRKRVFTLLAGVG